MPVAINAPTPQQASPIERIAAALGIVNTIKGFGLNDELLKKAQLENAKSEEDQLRLKNNIVGAEKELEDAAKYNTSLTAPGEQAVTDLFGKQQKDKNGNPLMRTPVYNTYRVRNPDYNPEDSESKPYIEKFRWAKGGGGLGDENVFKTISAMNIMSEMAKRDKEVKSPKFQFETGLSVDSQKQVASISDHNANVATIKNSIDAALDALKDPQIPEDQKIVQGNNLLKTLNSTEGKDAVGNQEADRLSSFLKYKIGNFTQPGSFIGRDLDKFTDQVAITSARLGDAYEKNQSKIDELSKNVPHGKAAAAKGFQLPDLISGKQKTPGGSLLTVQTAQAGQTGSIRVQGPDRKVRLIPSDQLDAAIAAGGRRVQ